MTNFTTIYGVLCQWNKDGNCHKMSQIVLHSALRDVHVKRSGNLPGTHALMPLTGSSPGEFGKLSKVGPKSAGPTRGAHSACACHAARNNVQDMGPHSSELAVLLAKEKGVPCRTRSWSLWLIIRLKMAWAPGAVLPNCSNTTGVMPLSKACRLYPSRCPYALHLVISSRRSSLATLRSRLTV